MPSYESIVIGEAVNLSTGGHGAHVTARAHGVGADLGANVSAPQSIQDPATGARWFTPGMSAPGGSDPLLPEPTEV